MSWRYTHNAAYQKGSVYILDGRHHEASPGACEMEARQHSAIEVNKKTAFTKR